MQNVLQIFLIIKLIIVILLFKEIAKYYHEKNPEIKSKMYETLLNETVPFYLDRFEQTVSDNGGYFVNGKVSILFWSLGTKWFVKL